MCHLCTAWISIASSRIIFTVPGSQIFSMSTLSMLLCNRFTHHCGHVDLLDRPHGGRLRLIVSSRLVHLFVHGSRGEQGKRAAILTAGPTRGFRKCGVAVRAYVKVVPQNVFAQNGEMCHLCTAWVYMCVTVASVASVTSQNSEFRIQNSEFRIQNSKFRIQNSEF